MWQQAQASQSPEPRHQKKNLVMCFQKHNSRTTVDLKITHHKTKTYWFIFTLNIFIPRFPNRIVCHYMSNSCPTKFNTLCSWILPAKKFWLCRYCRHGRHTNHDKTTSGPTSTMNMAHTLIMKKQNTDDHTKAFKPQVFRVLEFWVMHFTGNKGNIINYKVQTNLVQNQGTPEEHRQCMLMWDSWYWFPYMRSALYAPAKQARNPRWKTRVTNEPECSHVKHSKWNKWLQQSCTCIPCSRTSVDCGACSGVECRVWSVKTVGCWVGEVVWRVWSRECEVSSAKCKVWSVKCGV